MSEIQSPESPEAKRGELFLEILKEFIHFYEQKVPANWVNYLITITIGLEAISIGYFLSIGPLYIITQFKVSASFVGAIGALSAGILAAYVAAVGNLS